MDVSLAKSLRSLVAAAALLMGAYSIAASPGVVGGSTQVFLPSLGTVLMSVPRSMGFSSSRQPAPPAERSATPAREALSESDSALWVFGLAGACLAGVLLKRRFGPS